MKFELIHNEITLILNLTEEKNFSPHDRFNRIGNQTLIAIKNRQIIPYSIEITSLYKNEEAKFYTNAVLLSSNSDEVMNDLEEYLQNEEVLEFIEGYWKKYFNNDPFPEWKK